MTTDSPPITLIEPRSGFARVNLRELWAYRELLWVLTMRNIKVRYKQSALGVLWAVIRPVTMMVIFSALFGRLARIAPYGDYPYSIWVYAALLPWTFFQTSVGTAAESLVGSAQLIGKVYFPRLIIPLSSIGAALIDLALATVVLLVMMVFHGVPLTPRLLLLPFLLMLLILIALGVGSFLAALMVGFRDVRHATPFLLQIWMYLTPVIYPPDTIPEQWRWLMHLNPVAGLTEGSRAIFLNKPVDLSLIGVSLAGGVVLAIVGVMYFSHAERRFADII